MVKVKAREGSTGAGREIGVGLKRRFSAAEAVEVLKQAKWRRTAGRDQIHTSDAEIYALLLTDEGNPLDSTCERGVPHKELFSYLGVTSLALCVCGRNLSFNGETALLALAKAGIPFSGSSEYLQAWTVAQRQAYGPRPNREVGRSENGKGQDVRGALHLPSRRAGVDLRR